MQLLKLNKIKRKKKRNKHGSKRVTVDGKKFDSINESKRYLVLKKRQIAGKILNLRCHVKFTFELNGEEIGIAYIADFTYFDLETRRSVIEDSKAWCKKKKKFLSTDVYKLKKKLMKAFFGIEVMEV